MTKAFTAYREAQRSTDVGELQRKLAEATRQVAEAREQAQRAEERAARATKGKGAYKAQVG